MNTACALSAASLDSSRSGLFALHPCPPSSGVLRLLPRTLAPCCLHLFSTELLCSSTAPTPGALPGSGGATLLGSGNCLTAHRARLPLLPLQHGDSVHVCVCRVCAQLLAKPGAKCPLCRAVIEKVLTVFV